MRPNIIDKTLAADPQILNQIKTKASHLMVAVISLLLPFGLPFLLVKRRGLICRVVFLVSSTVYLSKTGSKSGDSLFEPVFGHLLWKEMPKDQMV